MILSVDRKVEKSVLNSLKVKKRDGEIVSFNDDKIRQAIAKAWLASGRANDENVSPEKVLELVLPRVARLPSPIDIERIQDIVEIALMELDLFSIAKAYVLYRHKRAEARLAGIEPTSKYVVIKRSGDTEPLSIEKITRRLTRFADGLSVDLVPLMRSVTSGLGDRMRTNKIDSFLAESAASLITEHPDYSLLAAKLLVSELHKNTGGIVRVAEELQDILDPNYVTKVREHAEEIESLLCYERDYQFDYFSIVTLKKAYLLRKNEQVVERPQDMWMRVALTVTGPLFDLERLRETYNLLSLGYYTHATPTLFNAGFRLQQLSSCFLLAMESDSIEGIFNTLKESALISRLAGGIGIHTHNIRSRGSHIKRTNGSSNGLIPFLKIFNETARSVDQGGGKRKGSFAIYLEPWHADIEEFLELRKNFGSEEFRARDLFYALWIPDLFMKRVEKDESWTLMSPSECPGLADVYGDDFEALYEKYERQEKGRKTIKARELMQRIIESQIEQGQPYMLYKDSVNRKSNQSNVGVIKSSNLCAEITEYSDGRETAVCNLASVGLPKFVRNDGTFDFEALHRVAYIATVNLNTVIEVNYYPTEKTRTSNLRHRPIALGVQGLADVFFKMNLPYDAPKARQLNRQIFETIYHAALEASCALAERDGPYEEFQGSPLSEGKFQFDLWDASPSNLWDFEGLRQKIKKHGVRNSLTTACMPTASTGIILGNTESFQIQSNNIYKRQTLSGEFMIINSYLVRVLEKLGLWNRGVRDAIVLANGSIQNIPDIPRDIKDVFRTTWEVSQKTVIEMAADRGPFIDQSQSMNLWLAHPTVGQVNSMHFYAWKLGLKTGMYYLRSQPATMAAKVTVETDLQTLDRPPSHTKSENSEKPIPVVKEVVKAREAEEECVACSA